MKKQFCPLYDHSGPCQSFGIVDLDTRIRQFLSSHKVRLNRDLGQHFLRDEAVLETIIEESHITPRDHIVEIGSGLGVLTEKLLQVAGHVTAIEFDERMIPLMQAFLRNQLHEKPGNLTIIHGNALHVAMPLEPYKVVANIPYHITSPLLRHVFTESPTHPTSLTLLIQKEVAKKICDPKHRGLLTIIVGLYGTPRVVLDVPPDSFVPPPEVDSAVLHIDCFEKPLADNETIERVTSLLKLGFGQKRKMLRNTFGTLPEGEEMMKKLSIDPMRRPETLTVEEWIACANMVKELRGS